MDSNKLPRERVIESERCFRQLAEHINEAFWLTDWINNKVLYVSPGYERIWGRPPESLVEDGRSWSYSIYPDEREKVVRSFLKNAPLGKYDEVYRIIRDDGQIRWIHDRAFPVLDQQGRVYRVAGLSEDITSFKSIEEEFRQSKDFLEKLVLERTEDLEQANASLREAGSFQRAIFEGSADPMIITDLNDIVKDANPAMERVFGYCKDELVGETFPGHIGIDDGKLEEWIEACRCGQGISGYETVRRAKDGVLVPVSITVSPVRNSAGELTHLSFLYRDIIERLKMEHALKESEEKHRSFVERANDGIAIIQDLRLKYVNPRLAEMVGYAPDKMLDQKVSDYVHPDELPRLVDLYNRRVAGEDVPNLYETYLMSKDGKKIDVEVNVGLITYQGKSASLVIYRDITEPKRAEEMWRRSEELNRAITDSSPIGISVRSRYGRLLGYNKSWQRIWNIPDEDILTDVERERSALVFDESDAYLGEWLPEVQRIYEQGGTLHVPEIKVKNGRPDSAQWVSCYFYSIDNIQGEVEKVVILTEDITERKRAQDERNKNQRELQALFAGVDVLLWSVREGADGELYYEQVNDSFAAVEGHTPEYYNGKSISVLHSPEECAKIKNSLEWAKRGEVHSYEVNVSNGNRRRFIEIRIIPLVDPDGSMYRFIGAGLDITERKIAEEALRRERQAFSIIADAAVKAKDIPDLCSMVVTGLTQTLGFDAGSIQLYNEQDRKPYLTAAAGAWKDAVGKGGIHSLNDPRYIGTYVGRTKTPIFAPDVHKHEIYQSHKERLDEVGVRSLITWPVLGSGRNLLGVIHLVGWEEKDNPEEDRIIVQTVVEMLATVLERKLADEALRESEERYRTLTEHALVGVYTLKANRFVLVNSRMEEITGYSSKKLLEMNVWDLVIKEDIEQVLEPRGVAISCGESVLPSYKMRIRRKDGQVRILEIRSTQLSNGGGDNTVYLGNCIDVTEREKTEQNLQRERQAFSIIADAAVHSQDISDLCDRVVNGLVQALGFDVGSIQLYKESDRTLALVAAAGIWKEAVGERVVQSLDNPEYIGTYVARTKTPVFAPDVSVSEIYKIYQSRLEEVGVRSLITWPVLGSGRKLLGIIHLVGWTSKNFQDEDRFFVQTVVEMFASVLERKQVEEDLKIKDSAIRCSISGLALTDLDGNLTYVNDSCLGMWGYENTDDVLGRPVRQFYQTASRLRGIKVALMRNGDWTGEMVGIRKNGLTFPVHLSISLVKDEKGKAICTISSFLDITERKHAEETIRMSEEKHRLLLGSIQSPVLALDKGMTILYCNQAYADFVSRPVRDLEGFKLLELFPFLKKTKSYRTYLKALETGKPEDDEGEVKGICIHSSVYPMPWGILAISTDVTAYKNAEKKLKQALEEKEALLKEIHHRVKNNLQVISSLLKLQAEKTSNRDAQDALWGSINRIKSMAIIHEKLYQSKDLALINMEEYLMELVDSLMVSYGKRADKVSVQFDIAQVSMGIDKAIPCALIVNELVTNSLKHAFPEERKGKIKIGLLPSTSESYELTVSDNGIGMPENLDLSSTDTLGLQLVEALVKQLKGSMELQGKRGSRFKIIFLKGDV